jgi:hypothetical protein
MPLHKIHERALNVVTDIVNDEALIGRITEAMAKLGHRWHDTPKGRTPTHEEVGGMLAYVCTCLLERLESKPDTTHAHYSTGGLTASYHNYETSQAIDVRYSPEGVHRTI